VPPGDVTAEPALLNRPRAPESLQRHGEAELATSWDEQDLPPDRDATLLAVVPVPGTGTSLAIVGYVIATSATKPLAGPALAGEPAQAGELALAGARPDRGQPHATRRTPSTGLRLDHRHRRAWADGSEIALTFQEFALLAFLAAHPSQVFTRADLVDRVWHSDLGHDGRPIARDSRTVDVHISRLRRKLGPRYGQCLLTEYRVGYQFRPPAR
jgi:Transcriptional regulatory protein, C terminal